MSVQSEITRIESAKTAIATAIEGKGVTVPEGTKLGGLAALVESIEAGGGGINATAGTITLSSDTNDYVLTHGLGEIPKFFAIGMINNASTLTGKTYVLIGGFGFSDVSTQYRISASPANAAPTGIYKNYSIVDIGAKTSFGLANDETITVAKASGTAKLIEGATYYWVAIGSGVF